LFYGIVQGGRERRTDEGREGEAGRGEGEEGERGEEEGRV